MLKSFSLIRNVGKFRYIDSRCGLEFKKLTLIHAENARGKSTLAAILRSLAFGDPIPIIERKKIGSLKPPKIVIRLEDGSTACFENDKWSRSIPEIEVFDETFIAENICLGSEIHPQHKENLHQLIIGSEGVRLYEQLMALKRDNELLLQKMRECESSVSKSDLFGYSFEQFCELELLPDLDIELENTEKELTKLAHNNEIIEEPLFPKLELPLIDIESIKEILRRSATSIEAEALERVQLQFEDLGSGSEKWVREGIHYQVHLNSKDKHECPFCDQSLEYSDILQYYSQYFSEEYSNLINSVHSFHQTFKKLHDGDKRTNFQMSFSLTLRVSSFWTKFIKIEADYIDARPFDSDWKNAVEAILLNLEKKLNLPLKSIEISSDTLDLVEIHNVNCGYISSLNEKYQKINPELQEIKNGLGGSDSGEIIKKFNNLKAVKSRYSDEISKICDNYIALRKKRLLVNQNIKEAQELLDRQRNLTFSKFEKIINKYLEYFGAEFKIGPVEGSNLRSGVQANYTIIIDDEGVPLSSKEPIPSFKNTLSTGDRSSLALAFFFAKLASEKEKLDQKIVVIDDPTTSMDVDRQKSTIIRISNLAEQAKLTIVLSHLKKPLIDIWEFCNLEQMSTVQILRFENNSQFSEWKVENDAMNEFTRQYILATDYTKVGGDENKLIVAQGLRPMLELYCQVMYPKEYNDANSLGAFCNYCNSLLGSGNELLAKNKIKELDELRDVLNPFHHKSYVTYLKQTSDNQLIQLVNRTLNFIQNKESDEIQIPF